MTVPKYYAVASEVATIEYLRSRGIPAPQIYGYSTDSDNAAGTPYILMEFIQGSKLSEVWPSLGDQEVISVVRQLTQLESKMMSLPFPAGGSLYFTKDLEKVAKGLGRAAGGQAFLRRSRHDAGAVVRETSTARQQSRTMYAISHLFITLSN